MWEYGAHFFRNGPAILPCLPASGARADRYPAHRAARRHPRQTCRPISKSAMADTEMRPVTISHRRPPRCDTCPVFNQAPRKIFSGAAPSEARCNRVVNSVSGGDGFEKARQAWDDCGCAARSAILVYARARETCRRPKIAAAFFEPNSPRYRRENLNLGLPRRLRSASVVTRRA